MINPSDAEPGTNAAACISKAARSPEELFPLLDFCRAGKLREVEEWIREGKPIDPPRLAKRRRRASPLEIAIDKGFYALTEVLLDGGCDPLANGNVLYEAVRRDEAEIADLLIQRGVPVDSVHISCVLEASPSIIKLFVKHGADPTAELAYYHALCSKVHPLLFVLKDHAEQFPALQIQAAMALCYHCEKGSPRNVGLLLWAGARPDLDVPDPNDPRGEFTSCALHVAARQGRIEILKQLKPQNYPDILKTLIAELWLEASVPLIDYLVGLGAPVNTNANGGCDLLEHLLWRLDFDGREGRLAYLNQAKVTDILATIAHLCRLGAKWIPDHDETPRRTRDRFRRIPPQHLLTLFRIFKETGAVSTELIDSVLASAALRKSLGSHLSTIEEVLHPRPAKASVAEKKAAGSPTLKAESLPLAEIRSRAKGLLLDVVRQDPGLHFTKVAATAAYESKLLRKRLGIAQDDNRDVHPIIEAASEQLNRKLKTFQTRVEWWGRANCRLSANLEEGVEWAEALREAWSFSETANDDFLTNIGLKLRELIRSGELGPNWIAERKIASRVGLFGHVPRLSTYLHELKQKTNLAFRWEEEDTRWADPHRYRIWVGEGTESPPDSAVGLNPKFEVRFDCFRKTEQDAVLELLYRELLKAKPVGHEPFFLVSIASRADLLSCFPQPIAGDQAAEFFRNLPLVDALSIAFDFRAEAKPWLVAFQPKNDWTIALEAIRRQMSRPTLEEQYGISEAAARLLGWIQRLPAAQMTGTWTPVVEEANERWIGLSCPWSEENFSAYLQMLLDEINERTEYDLALQPWLHYGRMRSRIRVKTKRFEVEDLVRQIQWLALQRGSLLEAPEVRDLLEQVLRRGA